jgi:hypothetical protein
MIVNRFDQLETSIERRPRLYPGAVLMSLVEHFVHGNFPISQVDAAFHRTFVSYINPGIASDLTNSHQPRSAIIQRAVALRNSVGAATSGSRFVSLMADGVRKAGRAWLGMRLVTAGQLHFWRLVHEVDQKVSTIANTLADTVLSVRMRRSIVCSIVTDNASNECAALNPECATSSQPVTGIDVLRTACLNHTGNLAIGDFLRLLGIKQATPCEVWTDMVGLRDGLTN